MTFGDLFKEVRKTLKLTQAEFGRAIGIEQGTVSKIEHDSLAPTGPVFLTLARLVGVSGDDRLFNLVSDFIWEEWGKPKDQDLGHTT